MKLELAKNNLVYWHLNFILIRPFNFESAYFSEIQVMIFFLIFVYLFFLVNFKLNKK